MHRPPFRARILMLVVDVVMMSIGSLLGSWVVPLSVAVLQRGIDGVRAIPRDYGVIPHTPSWITDEASPALFRTLQVGMALFAGVGLLIFARLGNRLWRDLGLRVLGWMTEEDIKSFYSERQWF